MNDKSEGFYLYKCLKGDSIYLYRKPQSFINKYNNIFSLSLCNANKKDDLTMWRLYDNDCNGVCLIYEVNMAAVVNSEEFFLMPVSYGEANAVVSIFKIFEELPYIEGMKCKPFT